MQQHELATLALTRKFEEQLEILQRPAPRVEPPSETTGKQEEVLVDFANPNDKVPDTVERVNVKTELEEVNYWPPEGILIFF
jgi:hypothetical protein